MVTQSLAGGIMQESVSTADFEYYCTILITIFINWTSVTKAVKRGGGRIGGWHMRVKTTLQCIWD